MNDRTVRERLAEVGARLARCEELAASLGPALSAAVEAGASAIAAALAKRFAQCAMAHKAARRKEPRKRKETTR